MQRRLAVVAVVLSLLAVPAFAADALSDHRFKLGVADPGVTFTPDRETIAMSNPATASNGQLLVFLGGIGDAPGVYDRLLRYAVDDGGYHSLGLDWVSGFETDARGTNIFYQCGDDDACFAAAWQEEFDGSDRAPKVRIGVTDSVLNRLIKALGYLDKTYPDEGWGAFLADGQPVWSRIALAGHSNGAGEAAYIASTIAVARVALFAGPLDSTGEPPNLQPATWMTGTHATPDSLWYAFGSERDQSRTLNRTERYLVTWPALGLGQPLPIDGMSPPFNDAHALTTNLAPCTGCTAQDMVATDKTLNDANGNAIFRPVWDYMLGSKLPAPGP